MDIPITFEFFGKQQNVHLIFETLAFFMGFRYFIVLRKRQKDPIHTDHRLLIILVHVKGSVNHSPCKKRGYKTTCPWNTLERISCGSRKNHELRIIKIRTPR